MKISHKVKEYLNQGYLSNAFKGKLAMEGDKLDYGQFLELCITQQPSGLGLVFKMGKHCDMITDSFFIAVLRLSTFSNYVG